MNGVIWSRMQETFVPISSVPVFAIMQQERLRQSRTLETHNFQLQNLTLTSFQEPHILEFYDNDMKVTGLCGELWTLLSEKLNFTLQPVKSNETLGQSEKNKTVFAKGLLGLIARNETVAIPKVETYNIRHLATDFTVPLWMNAQRLYIPHEITHDNTWMAKVFSWKIWCFTFVMYLLLSVCSFWSQTILTRIRNNCRRSTISDHIFYNFGMICNQNNIPDILVGRSRILEVTLGLFCSILFMAFGALLFVYITKRINIIPPFNNIESLLTHTSYKIVTLNGSIGHIAFKASNEEPFVQIRATKQRFVVASTLEEMFKLTCTRGKQKYTILQGEDEYKARSKIGCDVIPAGEVYFKMWVASGIARNFTYKRTIDLGILRLKEVGLWDALMDRWLTKNKKYHGVKAEGIEIDQVFLIILMMCFGMIIAFIIFVIEKIVYAYKCKVL